MGYQQSLLGSLQSGLQYVRQVRWLLCPPRTPQVSATHSSEPGTPVFACYLPSCVRILALLHMMMICIVLDCRVVLRRPQLTV